MEDKESINNSNKCGFNVLYSFIKPKNAQNIKLVITHQSYSSVWTPIAEGQLLKAFESYWRVETVHQMWWISWRQNLKQKKQQKLRGKSNPGSSRPQRRLM